MLPNSPDDDQPPSYEASAACASKARMKWRPRADTADDVQPATAEPNSVPPAHQPATDHPPTYFHNSASGDVVVVPEVLCPGNLNNSVILRTIVFCFTHVAPALAGPPCGAGGGGSDEPPPQDCMVHIFQMHACSAE